MAYAQTRVDCVGYRTDYTPNVEARNPIATPNSSKLTVKLTIQSACSLHSTSGTGVSTVSSGAGLDAGIINGICNAIRAEQARRGLAQTAFNPPARYTTCYPAIIGAINSAVYNMRAFSHTTPVAGKVMTASTDPNPAINMLNTLVSECVCYTDCRGYSVCYCHGYCNNY